MVENTGKTLCVLAEFRKTGSIEESCRACNMTYEEFIGCFEEVEYMGPYVWNLAWKAAHG